MSALFSHSRRRFGLLRDIDCEGCIISGLEICRETRWTICWAFGKATRVFICICTIRLGGDARVGTGSVRLGRREE